MAKKTKVSLNQTRAVVYIRVSTDQQKLGPDAQREACRDYAARTGLNIVGVYEDLGVSGATEMLACPGLMEAIAALKEENAGILLVAKRDRLGRDVCKIGFITQRVESYGARILSADGLPEDSSPASVMIRQIIDVLNQFERAQIAERTRAALAVKKRKGESLGRPPIGYRAEGKQLVVDVPKMKHLFAVQKYARDLYEQGLTLRAICDVFVEKKIQFEGYDWKHTMHVHRVLNHALVDVESTQEV